MKYPPNELRLQKLPPVVPLLLLLGVAFVSEMQETMIFMFHVKHKSYVLVNL